VFITLEGPEGCGKSTHAKLLKEYLGDKLVLTHEPGGTEVGQKIRDLLLHSGIKLDKISELCFFAADRAEHVEKVIKPALEQGKIILSDRYADSTTAYQVGGSQLPEDLVASINKIACKGLMPDLTILLDIESSLGLKRARVKGVADRFEKEKLDFHQRVRNKFLQIAKNDSKRVKIINTEKDNIKQVQEKIRKVIDEKLGN